MNASLLTTKFHFPFARKNLVARSRLTEQLKQGLQGPLTLISGSPGSGKTTLMSEWYAEVGQQVPVAWLSLDERDNDIKVFLAYLSASLDKVQAGLKNSLEAILESQRALESEMVLVALINSLSIVQTDFVLVLDDYHVIINPEIHEAVSFLVSHLPYQMHLVILTRVDPPLPLARLRSRGKLVELRDQDLRFTLDEATCFLRQVMQLPITDDHVAALETRTEGWVAGLQMAALSLAHQTDAGAFIQSFTGSHRYLLDYLVEEVIQGQPEHIRVFLEKTSILSRFTAPLCAAVTGDESSPQILSDLDRRNLFLIPLDEHREWYRYHHLFAELLRHRLQQTSNADLPDLYRRASDWCAQNKYTEEAIDYALQAQQLPRAAQLVQAEILRRLLVPSRWLRAFPSEILSHYPAILTAQSGDALLSHLGDATSMKTPLEKAEEAVANLPQDAPQRNLIEAHLLITKAIAAVEQYGLIEAMDWIRQAQPMLPPEALALRYYAQIVLSQAARNLGHNGQALQAATAAENIARKAGLKARAYIAVAMQMSIHIYNGNLQNALALGQQALAEYPSDAPSGTIPASLGGIYVYLAKILYEQNQLDRAMEQLHKGLQMLRLTQQGSLETHGYILAADIHAAWGDWEQAFQAIQQARQTRPIWKRTIGTAHLRLLLRKGDRAASEDELIQWYGAEHHLLGSASPEELARPVQDALCFEVLLRVILTLQRLGHRPDLRPDLLRAEQILEQRQTAIKALDDTQNLLSGYITLALVRDGLGKSNAAFDALRQALSLGAQHGYQRIFLDEVKPMENLLRRVIQQGEAGLYARQLLDVFQPSAHARHRPPPSGALIEPLTEREQDVLRLMAAGLSNPEIAQELYLSLNTVKTHTRGIYGKLGVSNRTQATNRARELGLIRRDRLTG